MLLLLQIDLSNADLALFEEYEAEVLTLLGAHGARLVQRLRSIDARTEVHLLRFPDQIALNAFRADPARLAAQDKWARCGATSFQFEVVEISQAGLTHHGAR